MKESQLKELIKEEYHNVKSFMEEKYGFTPELGKVIDNPYVSAFKAEDYLEEAGWSKSALDKFNRKPMPGRYFISDENGNVLEKGLKTSRSWVTYLHRHGKGSYGYLGGQKPKVVNIHDGKKNNEVVDQYYWVDKFGKGNYSIDIDNPTAGSFSKIDPKLVNYKEIEKQLGVNNESIVEYDVETIDEMKDFISFIKEYKSDINEAEYQGRDVKLGKIMQGDVKKFKVYVKNPKGNVVKVNFGHGGSSAKGKTMKIKKSNPERRKAFRARHNCDNPGPRHKARYWACRTW